MDSNDKTARTLDLVETVMNYEKSIAQGIDLISKDEQNRRDKLTRRANKKKKTIDANLTKQLQIEAPRYAGERDALRATKYAELGGYVSKALIDQYEMICARDVLSDLSEDERAEAENFADLKRKATSEQRGGLELAIDAIGRTKPNVGRAIGVLSDSAKINDVVSFVGAGKEGDEYVCLIASPLKDNEEYGSFFTSALASKLSELTESSPVTTQTRDIEFSAKKGNVGGMVFYKLELKDKDPLAVELFRDAMIERLNQLQPDEFANAGLRHVGVPVDIELFKYIAKTEAKAIIAHPRLEVQVAAVEPATGQIGYTKESILQEIAQYGKDYVFNAAEVASLLRVHRTGATRKIKDLDGVSKANGELGAYSIPRSSLENYVQTHRLTQKGTWREN